MILISLRMLLTKYPLLILILILSLVNLIKGDFWIIKTGTINDDLLNVQAIIVKDEEVTNDCKAKNTDIRVSHNIRAPLAVFIAPFADTAQVIKVLEYHIHPSHIVDPHQDGHIVHNVAIIKLTCKIIQKNLKEIKLPVEPISDKCADESCSVAIIKRSSKNSFVMYETKAKHSVDARKRREMTTDMEKNWNQTAYETSSNSHIIEKVSDRNESQSPIAIEGKSRQNNDEKIESFYSKSPRSIGSLQKSEIGSEVLQNLVLEEGKMDKKLFIRSSDGSQGCPQTGSPVMFSIIQSGIVSISCDDRQPESEWHYTDLFDNLNWINEIIDVKPSNQTRSGLSPGGCSTCIYNFFFDYNCKDKSMCPQNFANSSSLNDLPSIPGVELPKCANNHSNGPPSNGPKYFGKDKLNQTQLNQAYNDAWRDLYQGWHNHSEDYDDHDHDHDENAIRSSLIKSKSNENKPIDKPLRNVEGLVPPMKNKGGLTPPQENIGEFVPPPDIGMGSPPGWIISEDDHKEPEGRSGGLGFDEYLSDVDSSYREVKAIEDIISIDDKTPEKINLNFQSKSNNPTEEQIMFSQNSQVNLDESFGTNRYGDIGVPEEYALLYKKFLADFKKTNRKS